MVHGTDIDPEDPEQTLGSYNEVQTGWSASQGLETPQSSLARETLENILRKVRKTETPSQIEENRRLPRYLVENVPVEVALEDRSIGSDSTWLIDFSNIQFNDWLAVNQFMVLRDRTTAGLTWCCSSTI